VVYKSSKPGCPIRFAAGDPSQMGQPVPVQIPVTVRVGPEFRYKPNQLEQESAASTDRGLPVSQTFTFRSLLNRWTAL
jgi:hypothetical protein